MLLYASTTNKGKLREFLKASEQTGIQIEALPQLNDIAPPEETGATFEQNSILKAVYYSSFGNGLVFADDSGLEIDALKGGPGVKSARYAGEHATDAANNARVLKELEGVKDRRARFVSVISLARAGQLLVSVRGTVEGEMLHQPRGTGGFGYDPLFFCTALGKSLAEATEDEKFQVSHRGHAVRALFDWLREHRDQI